MATMKCIIITLLHYMCVTIAVGLKIHGCHLTCKHVEDNTKMASSDPITEAVKTLELQETYSDVGVASIHNTVEVLILSKPALNVLKSQPDRSAQILISHLKKLPSRKSDLPRIGFFVALGHLGQRKALSTLATYLYELPDDDRSVIQNIDHPFRYVLRAIERITGTSLGLGLGEDLVSIFERRYDIAKKT